MGIWKKIKLKLIAFLSDEDADKKPEVKTPEINAPPPSARYSPGLVCPQCGFRITLSIHDLLEHRPVVCLACGLALHVDRENSKACLDEVRKLNEALEEADKVRQG